MSITITEGVTLKCRLCNSEVSVIGAVEFNESGTGKRTAYYDPATHNITGVSEGLGDTFECFQCLAMKWIEHAKTTI